jgi:hypothetical protein
MIQNQKLLNRISQLIAQTFAIQLDTVVEKVKNFGVEATIEEFESQDNKLRY